MAKLLQLPSLQIIKGFRRVVDFYIHDGQACARKWPTKGRVTQSPASLATAQTFAYVQRYTQTLEPLLRYFATLAAADAPSTWRDVTLVSYYGLLIDDPPRPFTPFEVVDAWP